MTHTLKVGEGKWTGYCLVRDKDGKPKIDDPATLPQQIRDMLTDDEYFEIYGEKRK